MSKICAVRLLWHLWDALNCSNTLAPLLIHSKSFKEQWAHAHTAISDTALKERKTRKNCLSVFAVNFYFIINWFSNDYYLSLTFFFIIWLLIFHTNVSYLLIIMRQTILLYKSFHKWYFFWLFSLLFNLNDICL